MDWYSKDFGGKRQLISWLAEHLPALMREEVQRRKNYKLRFKTYDWSFAFNFINGEASARARVQRHGTIYNSKAFDCPVEVSDVTL
jgi:hypothetical protein